MSDSEVTEKEVYKIYKTASEARRKKNNLAADLFWLTGRIMDGQVLILKKLEEIEKRLDEVEEGERIVINPNHTLRLSKESIDKDAYGDPFNLARKKEEDEI